ncbi:unnamed protein product [Polarella glacialis]|uniref:EF-hand domain-containing protein n=1 Tax=Polarella glacialis TaxID=89957 RepID=A0A813K2A4_POLGL|nr:unnamed protein product [Polarella glacialis]
MNRLQAKMPTRASFLSPSSMSQVFTLMDQDGSGLLNGDEVQTMFNTICGAEVQTDASGQSYSLPDFTQMVEYLDAQYPDMKVAVNLMQYLKENAGAVDPDPLSLDNCQKLFQVLDTDGTGHLDLNELFQMFTFMRIHIGQIVASFQEYGEVTSAEELQQLVKEMDQKFPQLEIDEKVVSFLGVSAAAGGKPDMSSAEAPAEVEEAEPTSKKALLVGINYLGQSSELGGCINDVRNQMQCLIEKFGFSEDNILLLTEDQDDDSKLPLKANIQEGFRWLFDGASEGDLLFFQYSGHGSQMTDTSGTEADGKNECLCPLDCGDGPWPEYVILDNEVYETFYEGLPDGVKCICVFDCCHSATISDLQCTREISFEPAIGSRWMEPPEEVAASSATGARTVAAPGSGSPGGKMLWTFSGCQDNQTSADATIDGVRQGALTWGLLKALNELGGKARYDELLAATRRNLKDKYSQIPALSTSCEENLSRVYMGLSG